MSLKYMIRVYETYLKKEQKVTNKSIKSAQNLFKEKGERTEEI